MTFSKFTELCSPHRSPARRHFHDLWRTPLAHLQSVPAPSSGLRQSLICFLSLQMGLAWIVQILKFLSRLFDTLLRRYLMIYDWLNHTFLSQNDPHLLFLRGLFPCVIIYWRYDLKSWSMFSTLSSGGVSMVRGFVLFLMRYEMPLLVHISSWIFTYISPTTPFFG